MENNNEEITVNGIIITLGLQTVRNEESFTEFMQRAKEIISVNRGNENG